eukprot:1836707-Amphidinium_carterae.1
MDYFDFARAAAEVILRKHFPDVAPGVSTIDCSAAPPGHTWWPGPVHIGKLEALLVRLGRKRQVWERTMGGLEPWHPREILERTASSPSGLCLCVIHGVGAATLNA